MDEAIEILLPANASSVSTPTASLRPYRVVGTRDLFVDHRRLSQALDAAGASIDYFDGRGSLVELVKRAQPDGLIVGWESVQLLPEIVAACPDARTALVAGKTQLDEHCRRIVALPRLDAIFAGPAAWKRSEQRRRRRTGELAVGFRKLLSGDLFGLDKYLAEGAELFEEVVTSAYGRWRVLDRVSGFCERHQLRTQRARNFRVLLDELLTNAIWKAPVDDEGHTKYQLHPRDSDFELLPREAVRVRCGTDGEVVGISVTDRFGRLGRGVACSHLFGRSRSGPEAVNGMGLFLAYNIVSSLVINVLPDERTEVIGLLAAADERPIPPDPLPSFFHFEGAPRRAALV